MTNREGVGESRLIRLVRKWRLPLLLLLTGVVALDVRGAMGIASNLAYTACIGNAADPARRIEACTQIIDNQADGPDKRATAYFKRAYAWSMEGDLDRAIADSDQAISLNPEYASAYYNRGYDWATKGDYDRAIADYGQAIAFDPKSSAAYNNRGLPGRTRATMTGPSRITTWRSSPIQRTHPHTSTGAAHGRRRAPSITPSPTTTRPLPSIRHSSGSMKIVA